MRMPRAAGARGGAGVLGKRSVGVGRAGRAGRVGHACGPRTVVGVAVAVFAGAFSPPAASGWSARPTPNPAGGITNLLGGVSCTSATACTTVGWSVDSAGRQVTLADSWDGSRWYAQPTTNPAGATISGLDGVSCTSATACTAVGWFNNKAGQGFTLAERWDGSRWSAQATPSPGATNSELDGVSCTSATACTAVGWSNNKTGKQFELAERWDGSRWSAQPTPNPAGAISSVLDGVSCTSATACTAVGWFSNKTGKQFELAERWDGSRWSAESTPNPAGALSGELDGVSCTSATACTAVGSPENSARNAFTLAERWDGSHWSAQPTPNPAGAISSVLDGVSCTSATACTSVGWSVDSAGLQITLAEHWDGSRWYAQPTTDPTGVIGSGLDGVSCASATACTAVGGFNKRDGKGFTLAESWHD